MFSADVVLAGDSVLIADLSVSLESAGIHVAVSPPENRQVGSPYAYFYSPPLPPDLIIDLLTITYTVVLGFLLEQLSSWQSRPRQSIVIRRNGIKWTFEGSPSQIREQISNSLGKSYCMNCETFVPDGNYCDTCGNPLS